MGEFIAKRLRNVNVLVDAFRRPHWVQETCALAADEIDRLAAENAALREERDRLREALEAIERISHSVPDYAIFYEISRAALKWRTTG